jgi:hypothetical protein
VNRTVYDALAFLNRPRYTMSLILGLFLDRVFRSSTNYSIVNIIEQTRLDTTKALLALFHNIIEGLIANDKTLCKKHKKKKKNYPDICLP